jgi:hypothetical protein
LSLTIPRGIVVNISSLSKFEKAILNKVPIIIGKAKVQKINVLFLNKTFKEFLNI